MSIKFMRHLVMLFLLLASLPTIADGLDDADERLFRVQLSLAEKGDVRAQYFLGEMHEQGLGTKQDVHEAFKWYEKAAAKGDAWAKRKLAHRTEIEKEMSQEPAADVPPPAPALRQTKNPATREASSEKNTAMLTAQNDARTHAQEEEKIKAAEREKRRAAVRAMIRERLRHPIGEPFE